MSSRHTTPSAGVAEKPRRGRPPTLSPEERKQRILEAAESVFTDIGYGAATMEEIARLAGMSKRTLYGLYPDKRSLFADLISDIDTYPAGALAADPASSLKELRTRLLTLAELALSPRQIEVTRLVISEAGHSPELAEEFHERGIREGRRYLSEALQSFKAANPEAEIDDVERTAVTLFGAIIGDLHFRALLGEEPASRRVLQSQIDSAIALVFPNLRKR